MRTLRGFSFGPSSLCCGQRAAFAAHAFVPGIRFREQAAKSSRDSTGPENRSRGSPDVERLSVSSLRVAIHGGFAGNCHQRRLYSQIWSKKGKKSEKDLVLEDVEPKAEVLLEEDGVGEGEIGKLDGKKTTKKKKKAKVAPENGDVLGLEGDVANVVTEDVPDAELATKVKKEKKKKTKNTLKVEEVETVPAVVLNGASTGVGIQEPVLQPEPNVQPATSQSKGKKKLKNKGKEKEQTVDELLESDDSASDAVVEDVLAAELEEHLDDDDFWEDDFEPEAEPNDGGDGGGIVLGDAPWALPALELAEKVLTEFNGTLEIFAFKVSKDSGIIRVRVDKLSDKYGSPSMDEIQQFSSSYSKLLDEAGEQKTIPDNLALEVSSPGAERVVRLPEDLERFKDLPMYVRYTADGEGEGESPEQDGIMELVSVDLRVGSAKWKLADVRFNRDLGVKGRGMTRKQKDWRVDLPFESIQLVRLYIDL